MKIVLNGEEAHVAEGVVLDEVLRERIGKDARGVAIAVNNAVVRRTEWQSKRLREGDVVLLIQAAQGG